MIVLFLLLGCLGSNKDTGGDDGILRLTDANNWSYSGALTIDTVEVQTGQDVELLWDGLTEDIQGHAMDPQTEVDFAWLIWFRYLSHAEVETAIACDTVLQSDIEAAAYNDPEFADGTTSAWISELYIPPGNPFLPDTYFVYEEGTWFVRLTTGQNFTRRMLILDPLSTASNHDAVFTNDTSELTFDADLSSLTPFHVRPGTAYAVDWSEASSAQNGCDEVRDLEDADQLWLARYDGYSVTDLEDQVLDLEYIYSELYTAPAYGLDELDLSEATAADGTAFSGFDDGSVWLLALRCTTCDNPAPLYLTVIHGDGG